jgi:hypothetical protein
MNHSTLALFVAACVSRLGLSAESARANVSYLYTGNDFITASAPFTTNDKVMISLTLASALPPNLTVGGVNNASPLAFTASDGVDTFTDSTALGTVLFSFGTDNCRRYYRMAGCSRRVATVRCHYNEKCIWT